MRNKQSGLLAGKMVARLAGVPVTSQRVRNEMSLHVLAYNLTRAMQIFGAKPLMKAMTLLALVAALCLSVARAETLSERDIEVHVELEGDLVRIDTSFHVQATPQEAWAVMTDYDHAAEFLSDLDASRVLARDGDTMRVYQKGKAKFGPFSFPVESVRQIRLVPFESMQQHLVSGSMKRLDVTTRLAPEGSGTRITNRTESIPDVWIPPIVGRLFIAHETREKFSELRDEILRRKPSAAGR
jgi:carbon monoxide dehydrogenase subunit G